MRTCSVWVTDERRYCLLVSPWILLLLHQMKSLSGTKATGMFLLPVMMEVNHKAEEEISENK